MIIHVIKKNFDIYFLPFNISIYAKKIVATYMYL